MMASLLLTLVIEF